MAVLRTISHQGRMTLLAARYRMTTPYGRR